MEKSRGNVMEIWMFVFGLIAGSLLCIILTHLSSKLDDNSINEVEYYKKELEEDNQESGNMTSKKLKLTKEDIDTLITIICKKQLHMIKRDSCLYSSDKYNNLELLKAKLNNLYADK